MVLFFGTIFLLALAGQAGFFDFNDQQVSDGAAPVSWLRYVTSSDFGADVAENWQSEYLQFALYIVATVHLVQRGSPESKALGKEGTESDEDQCVGPHGRRDPPAGARRSGAGLWCTATPSG